MKSKNVKTEEKLANLQFRTELLESYSAKLLKRYEFMIDIEKDMAEMKPFIAKKDFKSDDFFNSKFKSLKSQLKLDKQLQEEYLTDSKLFIKNKINEIDEFFQNREKDEYEKSAYDDFLHQYNVLNRQTLLKSMLYENYSYLETKLREICNIIERKESRNLKAFAKNRKESYLDIYRKFLTGNTLNREEKVMHINPYRIIRNYLTHEVASFKSIPHAVKKILDSNPYLQLENRKVIIENEDYISNLIDFVHAYLELIIDELMMKNK